MALCFGIVACLLLTQQVKAASEYDPYYWEHSDYSGDVKDTGLSRAHILAMGLDRFCKFHNAQYEKREGMPPNLAVGDEDAELIYLWVQRQDNLHRLSRLPSRDRTLLRQLDAELTHLEHCECAMREELTGGGTAWLAYMREVGLRHEALLSELIRWTRAHPHEDRDDLKARAEFCKAIAGLEQKIRGNEGHLAQYPGTSRYRQALSDFKRHLALRAQMTAHPMPSGVLHILARYLPRCWWEDFEPMHG